MSEKSIIKQILFLLLSTFLFRDFQRNTTEIKNYICCANERLVAVVSL